MTTLKPLEFSAGPFVTAETLEVASFSDFVAVTEYYLAFCQMMIPFVQPGKTTRGAIHTQRNK